MFENMAHETFQLAVKPKVQGSWNLHELLPRDMDFFILLSSATGVLGNRSQANYAAGNTYQDFLAQYRRSIGLPASTIDLGTVLSVGYVAENRDKAIVAKHLGTVLEVIREDEIHILLEYLMDPRCAPPAQLVSGLTNAATYQKRGVPPPTYLSYPLFTQLRGITASRTGGSDNSSGFMVEALLNAATTLSEAAEIVTTAVCTKLSSLLAIPSENIDPNKSVSSNGVDSLVAMEFRTYLAKELKADIPVLDIMGTSSVTDLCRKIASISKAVDTKEERAEGTQAAT
jgi:acyl carrier protein